MIGGKAEEAIPVLKCWGCDPNENRPRHPCHKCRGTGSVFWAGGYAFPYTEDGEKDARRVLRLADT